jgi:hypothetical protein
MRWDTSIGIPHQPPPRGLLLTVTLASSPFNLLDTPNTVYSLVSCEMIFGVKVAPLAIYVEWETRNDVVGVCYAIVGAL